MLNENDGYADEISAFRKTNLLVVINLSHKRARLHMTDRYKYIVFIFAPSCYQNLLYDSSAVLDFFSFLHILRMLLQRKLFERKVISLQT